MRLGANRGCVLCLTLVLLCDLFVMVCDSPRAREALVCTSSLMRCVMRRLPSSSASPRSTLSKQTLAHRTWTLDAQLNVTRNFDALKRSSPVLARCMQKLVVARAPDIALSTAVAQIVLVSEKKKGEL